MSAEVPTGSTPPRLREDLDSLTGLVRLAADHPMKADPFVGAPKAPTTPSVTVARLYSAEAAGSWRRPLTTSGRRFR